MSAKQGRVQYFENLQKQIIGYNGWETGRKFRGAAGTWIRFNKTGILKNEFFIFFLLLLYNICHGSCHEAFTLT